MPMYMIYFTFLFQNVGEMSAWYLLSVLVHDIQTGEVTRFVADQWLSVDRGTFEDDITIAASKVEFVK